MDPLTWRERSRPWISARVTPRTFERIAGAAVVALVLVIISGAAVRLTGSGLGCPDWPECTRSSVAAPLQFHAWVEFGNRLINAFVTVASLGAFAASWRRTPRRRDLVVLSGGLVVGLVAEVVMGYFVVKYQLAPTLVSVHFLLGLVFLAVAVVLHHRAGQPDRPARKELVVAPVSATLARATLVALAVVATLGTIVTSTGPHGGSPSARRFGFALHDVARIHAGAADLFVGLTGLLLWTLIRSGAPRSVMRRAQVMLLTVLAQGAVGYTQYFIGDPVGLVAVHVAGASLLVLATLRFYFGLWVSTPAGADSLMLDDAVLVP